MIRNTGRRGIGTGLGKGYKNLVIKDPLVHSLSRKGIKTRQYRMPNINLNINLMKEKKEEKSVKESIREEEAKEIKEGLPEQTEISQEKLTDEEALKKIKREQTKSFYLESLDKVIKSFASKPRINGRMLDKSKAFANDICQKSVTDLNIEKEDVKDIEDKTKIIMQKLDHLFQEKLLDQELGDELDSHTDKSEYEIEADQWVKEIEIENIPEKNPIQKSYVPESTSKPM